MMEEENLIDDEIGALFGEKHYDQDFIDKINTHYIPRLLILIGFILYSSSFGITEVDCMYKAVWRHSWENYAAEYCFVEGFTFVNPQAKYPQNHDFTVNKSVENYEIIPLLVTAMALVFYLPRMFWTEVNSMFYPHFAVFCKDARNYNTRAFQDSLQHFDQQIYNTCPFHISPYIKYFMPGFVVDYLNENCLTITYIIYKLWQIISVLVVHVCLCNFLLQNSSDFFGFHSFFTIMNGVSWKESGLFPRLAICGFNTRQLGIENFDRIRQETVQCVLKGNMFLEYFFLFYFIVSIGLLCLNLINFICWLKKLWFSIDFLCQLVKCSTDIDFSKLQNKAALSIFARTFSPNGRFVLLMIHPHAAAYAAKSLYYNLVNFDKKLKLVLQSADENLVESIDQYYSKNF